MALATRQFSAYDFYCATFYYCTAICTEYDSRTYVSLGDEGRKLYLKVIVM